MAFDPKCFALAEHFLPTMASDRLKMALAQHIQDSVEDWCETEAERIKAGIIQPAPPGTVIVHLLRSGFPRCGFTRMPPGEWPEGHKWEGADRVGDVNCPACRVGIEQDLGGASPFRPAH